MLGLCGDLLSVCLKRDQFLRLHLINFRYSKFGTKHCLFCADINLVCLLLVRCGFREWAPLPAYESDSDEQYDTEMAG